MEFRRVLFRSFPPALPFRRRALPARDAKAFGDGDRRGILPRGGGEPPAPGRARAAAAGHRELVCNRSFRAMAVNNRIAEFHDEMKGWRRNIHARSEEHTSELQSLMRNSYAVFCLKKKK